jgi:hypothetical protein
LRGRREEEPPGWRGRGEAFSFQRDIAPQRPPRRSPAVRRGFGGVFWVEVGACGREGREGFAEALCFSNEGKNRPIYEKGKFMCVGTSKYFFKKKYSACFLETIHPLLLHY